MLLEELIKPDSVLCNAHARSKKHCLEILSELLVRSTPEIGNEEIFDNLVERERLGCTSLDQGVAFPHCRVDGIDTLYGALIKLTEPVEFDSPDGEAVDLVFGLMVPADIDEDTQDKISRIAERLLDPGLRTALREANTSADLYAALVRTESADAEASLAAARGG